MTEAYYQTNLTDDCITYIIIKNIFNKRLIFYAESSQSYFYLSK